MLWEKIEKKEGEKALWERAVGILSVVVWGDLSEKITVAGWQMASTKATKFQSSEPVNIILYGNLSWCDEIKDLEIGRLFQIIWVGPKCYNNVFVGERQQILYRQTSRQHEHLSDVATSPASTRSWKS